MITYFGELKMFYEEHEHDDSPRFQKISKKDKKKKKAFRDVVIKKQRQMKEKKYEY